LFLGKVQVELSALLRGVIPNARVFTSGRNPEVIQTASRRTEEMERG
jgi:hypothetical protein